MSKITDIIGLLKDQWGNPREAVHRGKRCPFLLACRFAAVPAKTVHQLPVFLPEDLRDFWLEARTAALFEDQQYGQWGVVVLDPEAALSETSEQAAVRPGDFVSSDLIIARFSGDSDLVVVRCDPRRADFGAVTIALPIEPRSHWPVAASSFGHFLEKLTQAQGDKYWENNAHQ
jgi:hypothetical protein